MEYSNPEIPEGINTSKSHPLKEFLWLTSGVMASFFVLILTLVLLADVLTAYIPYSLEQKINLPELKTGTSEGPLTGYLQSMADRIAQAEGLPEEMSITVHYMDDETVNAFATLGGHVFLFRGLLEKLPNENALAMLMAHEIAHIKYRHPIKSLGRGVIAAIGFSLIGSAASDALIENFIGGAGYLTILKYSRDMESAADATAIDTLTSLYGHLNGADDLFKILQKEAGSLEPPAFFSTHPLTEDRINEINAKIASRKLSGINQTTALPQDFTKWVESQSVTGGS